MKTVSSAANQWEHSLNSAIVWGNLVQRNILFELWKCFGPTIVPTDWSHWCGETLQVLDKTPDLKRHLWRARWRTLLCHTVYIKDAANRYFQSGQHVGCAVHGKSQGLRILRSGLNEVFRHALQLKGIIRLFLLSFLISCKAPPKM